MNKQMFESPRVIRRTQLELEQSILAASAVESMQVETTGQEVVTYGTDPGTTDSTFNHEWY